MLSLRVLYRALPTKRFDGHAHVALKPVWVAAQDEKSEWERDVQRYRLFWVLVVVLSLIFRKQCDVLVASIWLLMYESAAVRHDSFEPLLSTASFFLWINMFRIVDEFGCFAKYRISPRDDKMGTWKEGQPNYSWMPSFGRTLLRPILFFLPQTWRGLAAVFYLAPLLLFDFLYPRRQLRSEAPTFHGLTGSICASIFCYDFAFYWIHLAEHKVKHLQFLRHRWHHTSKNLSAAEVVRHSFLDGTLQVSTNILVLNLLRLHPMARALHDVVITYMLSEIHSGYDMPWMLHNVAPEGLLGGSPRHEAHHRRGDVYFHQFFTYLDYWLGHTDERRHPQQLR